MKRDNIKGKENTTAVLTGDIILYLEDPVGRYSKLRKVVNFKY